MDFRESINNLIRSDKPESCSRALALVTGLFMLAWISYALLADKIPALLGFLAIVLAYICTLLGLKQMDDRKKAEIENANPGTNQQ